MMRSCGMGRSKRLHVEAQRLGEPEEERRSHRRPWHPVAEDHRRQGDKAAAGGDVGRELREIPDREVGAADRGQHAGHDDHGVAVLRDIDADRLRRFRLLATGEHAQPGFGLEQEPVRQRHQQEGDGKQDVHPETDGREALDRW